MYSLESYSKHQRKSGKTSFTTAIVLIVFMFVLIVLSTQDKLVSLSKNPLIYISLSTIILLFLGTGAIFFERSISSQNIRKDPIVINCPSGECEKLYKLGTSVTLTATPGENSYFVKWTGRPCKDEATNVCTFTMDKNATVKAIFQVNPE